MSPILARSRGLALTLLVLLLGCDAGTGTLATVRGRVSYRGIPLRTGTIVFTPDPIRGHGGLQARADIGTDGTYVLRTGDTAGAALGWHRVTIMALEPGAQIVPGAAFSIPRSLLPDKYRDPELSGLTCEVEAGKENVIDFNLE
jgi:hypothetical protein